MSSCYGDIQGTDTHDTFNTPVQVAVQYSTVQVAQYRTVLGTVPYPTTQHCTVQYNELVT